jgi:hypothetical protein
MEIETTANGKKAIRPSSQDNLLFLAQALAEANSRTV